MSGRPSDHPNYIAVLEALRRAYELGQGNRSYPAPRVAETLLAALAPVTPASGGAVPERGVDAAMVERAAVVYAAHADNPDQSVYLPAFRAALIAALTPAGSVPDGEG